MRGVTIVGIALMAFWDMRSTVSAQTATAASPPGAAANPTAYCSSGAAGFALSDQDGLAEVRQKCKRGDTILIPASSTGAVARICDFSHAVVSTGGSVICVIGLERSKR